MEIEKVFFPESDKLVTYQGEARLQIVDAELDEINCVFNYDGCVQLDVKDYSYITLTPENLSLLKRSINKAEKYYDEYFKNEDA